MRPEGGEREKKDLFRRERTWGGEKKGRCILGQGRGKEEACVCAGGEAVAENWGEFAR